MSNVAWRPSYGLSLVVMALFGASLMISSIVMLVVYAYAADKPPSDSPFDWQGMLVLMIPALWATIGPVVMKGLTMTVNKVASQYVPRPLQVIGASILGAIAAAFSGDMSVAAATAVTGGASQVYASTEPYKLHADPPPQGVAP